MMEDLIGLFKSAYEEYGDKIILDNYILKNGIYIKIDEDNKMNYLIIKARKNDEGVIEYIPTAYQEENTAELYDWFKTRDYYSSIVDMNKSIDKKKKIHSNNYLSLFIKKDNLIGENKLPRDELYERISEYYAVLGNLETKYSDTNSKLLYETVEPRINKEDIIEKYKILIQNMDDIILKINNMKEDFEGYVKIFISEENDLSKYELEYRRYIIPNVFNKNDYNITHNGEIFGLSNNNMGMNSKKTYLELKTTKFKVPFRVSSDNAMILSKFFNWLSFQSWGALYIPVGYNFKTNPADRKNLVSNDCHYLYITKGKEVIIEDYEILPRYSDKIYFEFNNYLQIEGGEKGKEYLIDYGDIDQLWRLENEVDEVFFNKRLKAGYFNEPGIKNDFSKKMVNILILSRDAFYNYFYKGNKLGVFSIIDRFSSEIVNELISNNSLSKAAKAQNLRLSFQEYFQKEDRFMGGKIKGLLEDIQEKIKQDDTMDLSNDEEFYFLSGQLAYFILSKSSASKKTHDMIEGFTKAKNSTELKKQLLYYYDKYKHAFSFSDRRFNKAFSMAQGYDTEDNGKKEDLFISGLLAKNIFYISSK